MRPYRAVTVLNGIATCKGHARCIPTEDPWATAVIRMSEPHYDPNRERG